MGLFGLFVYLFVFFVFVPPRKRCIKLVISILLKF